MTRVAVLHGPNLNLLGTREPEIYGRATLEEINQALVAQGRGAGAEVACFQSNHEGALVDEIARLRTWADTFIINAAAYTHTSIAIRDALSATGKPFIEVHLSNVFKREGFRHHSTLSDLAEGVMTGFGPHVYRLALEYVLIKAGSPRP